MYEVQKAFEDQKEEYQAKEKRFKQQEGDLREKDIMIQDNLIKFSTFLQQQEMRRKKDTELYYGEQKKIEQLVQEIDEKEMLKKIYSEKAETIFKKVQTMKRFEEFLELVKEEHQEEFPEIIDILSRYK